MPLEYQKDGDLGFIGLNSRDNPAFLPKGFVSKSENFRLDRGVATVRKGLKRKTSLTIINQTIYGTGCYLNGSGQEIFVIVMTDGLYTYNPSTEIFSSKIPFPAGQTIVNADITAPNSNGFCDVVTAIDKIYITRGHSKRPLICTLNTTSYEITSIIAAPTSGTGSEFPNCSGLMYYANRLVAIGQHHSLGYTPTARSRDTVCVSNYLDFDHWDVLDTFVFNEGSNDEIIAIAPWTLTEFTVFLRNSIYYVNVGVGRYVNSDTLNSNASMKLIVSDVGCIAKRSIVQANGGIMFLSDNGVYFMNPMQVGSNESVRLLTGAEPVSKDIDDIIQTINKTYAFKSVATYWNNRYYLAVPTNGSSDNDKVLVFNFILKAWESVDVYPTGFDVFNFQIGKQNSSRKLFGFDTDQGIFIFEELNYDEYGAEIGTPKIPFYLPTILSGIAFTPVQINSTLETRRYTFDSLREKRFSSVDVEFDSFAGSHINTYADVQNQDTYTLIDSHGSETNEDYTRRNPVRKTGTGIQFKFTTDNLRTSIRSINVTATVSGKTNLNKQ